jgi:hypothetical protein
MQISPVLIFGHWKPRTPCAQRVCSIAGACRLLPTLSHNGYWKSSFKSLSRHVLLAPLFVRNLPIEAETPRNSLSRRILQRTSLLSGFCSVQLPVNPRKQGICLQNMGGGTPSIRAHRPDSRVRQNPLLGPGKLTQTKTLSPAVP